MTTPRFFNDHNDNKNEQPKDEKKENKADFYLNAGSTAPGVFKVNNHLGLRTDGKVGYYVGSGPVAFDLLNGGEISFQYKL